MKKTRLINIDDDEPYDVYIGRPSKWGNPYKIKGNQTREMVIKLYENYIHNIRPELLKKIPELKGKTLACHCKPFACHGDVLLKLVAEMCGEEFVDFTYVENRKNNGDKVSKNYTKKTYNYECGKCRYFGEDEKICEFPDNYGKKLKYDSKPCKEFEHMISQNIEECENYTFSFGKYKGQKVSDVMKTDEGYVDWAFGLEQDYKLMCVITTLRNR